MKEGGESLTGRRDRPCGDPQKVLEYLAKLLEEGYHGRIVISVYGGKVTSLRTDQSRDLRQFE